MDEYVGPGVCCSNRRDGGSQSNLWPVRKGFYWILCIQEKAIVGLIDLIRKGYFKKDENVVFIHSGGSPALYAYTSIFS